MLRGIDLFSGGGGFTTGAKAAGINMVWAANHWGLAVDIHEKNHPEVKHACQDVEQADWRMVPEHDILLASPACQGHSPARGKEQPHHDARRSTAWAVISALEYHRPLAGVVENVPEFLTKWALFPAWKAAAEALGYAVSPHIVDAANHGVPQHRERMFLLLTRSKAPLVLDLPQRPYVPASEIIDFSDSCRWSRVDKPGRSPATLARISRGRQSFGDRFVMPYYSNGSGLTGRSLARPLGTITTRDRWAVVDGDRMRMLNTQENRKAMGFPSDYILPKSHKDAVFMLGNAVCPPAAEDFLNALQVAL